MDPQLNLQPAPMMQDIQPPRPAPPVPPMSNQPVPSAPGPTPQPVNQQPPQASPPQTPVSAQLVESIPLRQPGQAPQPTQAVDQPPHMPNQALAPEPDELDTILQAVNNRVKAPPAPVAQKPKVRVAIPLTQLNRLKPKLPTKKPLGIMVVTLAVFAMLATTAVIAYRQGAKNIIASQQPSKVGTSYTASAAIQAAGGLLVKPSDLDDYKQNLQTKMGALNDGQDFDAKPLSDQMLGL